MSCIAMTSCVLRQPARVLTSLVSPSNFVITPFGKADLLIIGTFIKEYSEESSTSYGTNCISGTDGHGCFLLRKLDLGPMVVELRCVVLNFVAFIFES